MIKVAVIVAKDYKLLSAAAVLDVFDTVNKLQRSNDQEPTYDITVMRPAEAEEGQAFYSHHPVATVKSAYQADLVLITSFTTEDLGQTIKSNSEFIPWLAAQYKSGAALASFCTGAFLLGATGLLNGKVVTTHVDACGAFAKAFPEVLLMPDKTVTQDGRFYTSGGATSTFHLLLHLIQRDCGREMAVRIAKIFAIDMDRQSQTYFSTFHPSRDHTDNLVATAQQKIEDSYNSSGTIEEIIRDIPSSRRNMVRRFKQVTGVTPIEYLQLTRVEAAKRLLEQTQQQMTEVIFNTGYNDPKAFRKVFRKTVGMTPTEYREKFQPR